MTARSPEAGLPRAGRLACFCPPGLAPMEEDGRGPALSRHALALTMAGFALSVLAQTLAIGVLPVAGLLIDLKRRGLLDDTIVLWAGEFGRTVYSQGQLTNTNYGRDHHPRCFTAWMAGGGTNAGTTYGKTDDYSYNVAEDPVEVHDLHATLLHLLGFDHTRLTYRFQGRDYRLTDVKGQVIPGLMA